MKALLYDMLGLNLALFEALQAAAPVAIRPLAQALSWTAEPRLTPLLLLALAAVARWRGRTDRNTPAAPIAGRFAWSAALALTLAWGIKLAFDFPRPGSMPELAGRFAVELPSGASFPSGHAVVAAVVVTTLWSAANHRWVRAALILWALAVFVSRVVLGAHFPADVVWGGLIGVSSALAAGTALTTRHAAAARALRVAIAVLIADVLTKAMIVSWVPFRAAIEMLPVLNLVFWLNEGAAFGLLRDAGGWQRGFLVVVGVAASIWLVSAIVRGRFSRREKLAFGAILGGAVANVFDRLLRGAVVDWIDLHGYRWHWPAFNLADAAISIGAAGLVVMAFRSSGASKSTAIAHRT